MIDTTITTIILGVFAVIFACCFIAAAFYIGLLIAASMGRAALHAVSAQTALISQTHATPELDEYGNITDPDQIFVGYVVWSIILSALFFYGVGMIVRVVYV